MNYWYFIGTIGLLCNPIQGKPMNKNKQHTNRFSLYSNAFENQTAIPAMYTCDGKNISPALTWQGIPEGTKSFALIVDDPDAPSKVWVHWILFNIPPTITELKEGSATTNVKRGTTDFNNMNYGGPCPPAGTHHYRFTLYALNSMIELPQGTTKEQLLVAMQGHIIGTAELIGTYTR
jgi:Raf kinase inhibitor-like YbhB/YbcL family protein